MQPMYKFVGTLEAVQFLLKGSVKFTPIAELNDPSELVPNVITEAVLASLHHLRQRGYSEQDLIHLRRQERLLQRLAPRFHAISAPRTVEIANAIIRSRFYDNAPLLEDRLRALAREMSDKVGLLCLSLRSNSLPMGAHYANNAAGFAVQFRDLDSVFSGDESGVLFQPIAVRYEREKSGVTFGPQSHQSLFFAKFQDWEYEQEIRIVLPLDACRRESLPGRTLYLYDIPRHCVARVILGWNTAPKAVGTLRRQISTLNPDVEIHQARFVRGSIELSDITPSN